MPEAATIPTARPPDLATFTLLVDGAPAPPELHLLTAEVSTALNRVPVARFTFRDGDAAARTFALSEAATFAPGAEVEFRLGYHGEEEPVFRGVVTRHGIQARSGRPSQLHVECRHAAFRLTLAARARQFTDQTDADLAAVIAAEAGLAADFAASDVTHPQMVQWAATDWDFLLLRARANGLVVLAGLDALTWFKPDPAADPALTLAYGGNLELFEGELEARAQPASVTARGWDPAGQEAVESEAERAPDPAALLPDALRLLAAAPRLAHDLPAAENLLLDPAVPDNVSGLVRRLRALLGDGRDLGAAAEFYDEADTDGINEWRFRLRDTGGSILLSSSRHYHVRAEGEAELAAVARHGDDLARYERRVAEDGRFYFNLTDATGEVIARRWRRPCAAGVQFTGRPANRPPPSRCPRRNAPARPSESSSATAWCRGGRSRGRSPDSRPR